MGETRPASESNRAGCVFTAPSSGFAARGGRRPPLPASNIRFTGRPFRPPALNRQCDEDEQNGTRERARRRNQRLLQVKPGSKGIEGGSGAVTASQQDRRAEPATGKRGTRISLQRNDMRRGLPMRLGGVKPTSDPPSRIGRRSQSESDCSPKSLSLWGLSPRPPFCDPVRTQSYGRHGCTPWRP